MAAPNNRSEALRIVATVLDFSREERARVGLEAGSGRSVTKGGTQTQVSSTLNFSLERVDDIKFSVLG